jgi:DNA-binding response OmpR family regulator
MEFIEAESLAETSAALEAGDADVLFVDHRLPDGCGIEFARELAQGARRNAVPVVVVTSSSEAEIVTEALRAGAADYLRKDALNVDTFDQAVENAMRRSARAGADQSAIISNLRSENETLRRIAVRNMRLLKGQTMPLISFAWRALQGGLVEESERARTAKGLGRITRNVTGLIDDTVITCATHRANDALEAVDLTSIIESVIQEDLGEIANSRVHIKVGKLPVVKARASQMTMLFEELLLSSIRSSRLGQVPEIEVSAGKDPKGNSIVVFKENGLRLSARKQSLSERFSDLGAPPDDSVRDELSWSLCQRLVEKNDGQFRISENSENGSTIMIRFPSTSLVE